MIELFVKRPAMTVMLVLVFVVLGIVSFFNLNVERYPKVSFPLVSIKAIYPGASPSEIESQIVKKIEDATAEISEIKKIQTTVFENFALIMIEFDITADVNIKAIEVKDKVEAIANELPSGAKKPEIAKFDPLVQPILDLVLTSSDSSEIDLYEYADKSLRNQLTTIEGVASVDLIGGRARQINIRLDRQLMKKYFISINEILESLTTKNLNIPGGAIEGDASTVNVRFVGEFETVQDISNLIVVSREGMNFKLSDIATVEDGARKIETISRYNSKNVVGLAIKKLSDGDAVTIAKKVKDTLGKIKKSLPSDMSLVIARDTTKSIISENNDTIVNIIIGLILTVIILFLFLGNIKTTIVASIVIPTSLISAFFLMDFSKFSINMLTLLAVATSLGTLIANALVVIENIMQHLDKDEDPVTAAVNGTKEVAVAVFASAGTNLVVFTPIAFMGGIIGQFMNQFGLTVVYVTLFSILASFTITPMLCALLLKPKSIIEQQKQNWFFVLSNKISAKTNLLLSYLVSEYEYIFNFIMSKRLITVVLVLLMLFSVSFPIKYIGSEFFSKFDQNLITLNIKTPQGSSLEKTKNVVLIIENLVKDIEEVDTYLSSIGKDGYENASIILNLIDLADRDKSDMEIVKTLTPKLAEVPGAEISIVTGEESGTEGGDVSINVFGSDYKEAIKLSKKMELIMKDSGFFMSVDSSYKNPKQEIKFKPNQQKMTYYGLKNIDVGSTIRASINGNDDSKYKERGEEYKINVELNDLYKNTIEDIKQISLISKDGLLPISMLGSVEWAKALPSIKRRDKRRVIQLNGYLSKSTAGVVQSILVDKFRSLEIKEDYGYKFVGQAEFFDETAKEITKAFLIAVVLTYMLLVAILNSFLMPFAIVSAVAMSFVGVFLLLFFTEFSMNIGSMMAIVMLVGIAVNNAILMIDFAIQKLKDHDIKTSIWLGATVKFRTILMTSLAIVFWSIASDV